jgi:hypothetical protein
MINVMKQWFIYTLPSIILGFVLGYILLWGWYFIGLLFLGYGDSGPPWVNSVNDIVFYSGIIAGIVGGQFLFALKRRKVKDKF